MKEVITLRDAIALSGDSRFRNLTYDGATLTMRMELGEDDREVVLIVKTRSLACDMPVNENLTLRMCRIAFEPLGEHFQCENGHYIPPLDFGAMMKDVRSGRSLAYGKRRSNDAGILSIVGYSRLASCFVESERDIWIQEK